MPTTPPPVVSPQLRGSYWMDSPFLSHGPGCACGGAREATSALARRRVPAVRTVMLCIAGATVAVAVVAVLV
ncbi:hypothetical protein [Streptomyces sp. NPDC059783]|uniref:hypothetical protein n=1 Tax=Streptomyces sp. NPDC059783 TaxID=3346944 RepID=UPI00365A51EB